MKKKPKPKHSELEKDLMRLLANVCISVDEDMNGDSRSDELRSDLKDSFELLKAEGYLT